MGGSPLIEGARDVSERGQGLSGEIATSLLPGLASEH